MVGSNDERGNNWDTDLEIVQSTDRTADFAVIRQERFNQARSSILAWIKEEIVPKERKVSQWSSPNGKVKSLLSQEDIGFNQCREEILNKINENT
jgi:hypothetical protein